MSPLEYIINNDSELLSHVTKAMPKEKLGTGKVILEKRWYNNCWLLITGPAQWHIEKNINWIMLLLKKHPGT